MGAAQCKCCAKEGELDSSKIIQPAQSSWDEVDEKRDAKDVAVVAVAEPPPVAQPRTEPVPPLAAPEKAALAAAAPPDNNEPATQPTSPRTPRPEPPLPADVKARCKRSTFQLEAGRPLDVRFVAVKPNDSQDDNSTIAVVNTIGEKSPLATTSGGQPGLRPGDVILEVNGQKGFNANVLEVMNEVRKYGGKMDLEVCTRPKHFTVDIKRPADRPADSTYKMGVVVAVHDDIANRVEVRNVSDEGAVADWNQSQPFRHVCVHDWVTKVEGTGATGANQAKTMIEEMQTVWKNNSTLTLSVTPGNCV